MKNPHSKNKVWKTGIYIRLSREDENEELSLSVQNQRDRLVKHVLENADEFELVNEYIDDGYTGTDSNRKNFQKLLDDIRNKLLDCVIVKDLSRLSRNYIEAGNYLEQFFIEHNVRFISLELPSLDSYKRPDEMNSLIVPIQNVINDDFCRQTSIKVRSVFKAKQHDGQFVSSFAPYGYLKDPNDKNHFIVDNEAGEVVKMIYQWFVDDGVSQSRITRKLNELQIPNPTTHKQSLGMKYQSATGKNDGLWCYTTVHQILNNPVYLGHMVGGKSRQKSYKVHETVFLPKDDWIIVENMHEPIISQETFDKSQELQSKNIRTSPQKEHVYLWSGLLKCADCNRAMVRNQSYGSSQHVYYNCTTYRKAKEMCSKHTIREDNLYNAVLVSINAQINLVSSMADIIETINMTPKRKHDANRIQVSLESVHTN